jgi:hypothetical protein
MHTYRSLGPIAMLLILMIRAVSVAGEHVPSQASSPPTLEGTYTLMSRTLPDGTRQFPPDIIGLMTYTKDYQTVNIMWKEPDGKLYALALGSTYTLTPTEFRETLLFVIETDQITGTGTHYDFMPRTRTASVTGIPSLPPPSQAYLPHPCRLLKGGWMCGKRSNNAPSDRLPRKGPTHIAAYMALDQHCCHQPQT